MSRNNLATSVRLGGRVLPAQRRSIHLPGRARRSEATDVTNVNANIESCLLFATDGRSVEAMFAVQAAGRADRRGRDTPNLRRFTVRLPTTFRRPLSRTALAGGAVALLTAGIIVAAAPAQAATTGPCDI